MYFKFYVSKRLVCIVLVCGFLLKFGYKFLCFICFVVSFFLIFEIDDGVFIGEF